MQAQVEIRYAGIVIASAQVVRELEAGGEFLLAVRDPLPVGTLVTLRSGETDIAARVTHVAESANPASSGMQVRPVNPADCQSTLWIPPAPPAPPSASDTAPATTASEAAPAAEVEELSAGRGPVSEAMASAVAELVAASVAETVPVAASATAQPVEPAAAASEEAPVARASEPAAEPAALVSGLEPAPEAATEAAPLDEYESSGVLGGTGASISEAVAAVAEAAAASEGAEAARVAEDGGASDETSDRSPAAGDLPPARPTQSGNARRRGKRRR